MPANRFLAVLGALIAILSLPAAAQAAASSKYASIVVDAVSGEVLYADQADAQRFPASITKVMTMYMAFEALERGTLRLDEYITISKHAAGMAPTKLGLKAGETIMVDDVIRALSVKSANDMAAALAERLGGTEAQFALMMTAKAKELGMTSTNFANASGLPNSRQLSTARDIAVLSRSVMRDYPQYYGYFSVPQFTFRGSVNNNHNGLLGKMPGVDGLKTGFTSASGYNLAASAVRDGRRLIAVVLGGSSTASRNNNVEQLLLTGFDVLDRRARGEVVELASLFAPPPVAPVLGPVMALTEQGDSQEAATGTGDWAVQVGSFRTRALAQLQLRQSSSRYTDLFKDAKSDVDSGGGSFRARFNGFSEAAARSACKTLSNAKAPCLVVGPS